MEINTIHILEFAPEKIPTKFDKQAQETVTPKNPPKPPKKLPIYISNSFM